MYLETKGLTFRNNFVIITVAALATENPVIYTI